jgi:hypothetical protein
VSFASFFISSTSTDALILSHSVDGKVYFETLPLRASFVRPDKVTVGDFPEIDPFAEDEEDMEM